MNKRKIEIKKDSSWVQADFMDLKKGDVFRIFDVIKLGVTEKEKPVSYSGNKIFKCCSDAYIGEDNIPTVNIIKE